MPYSNKIQWKRFPFKEEPRSKIQEPRTKSQDNWMEIVYPLKIKYTASTRKTNPIR